MTVTWKTSFQETHSLQRGQRNGVLLLGAGAGAGARAEVEAEAEAGRVPP